MTMGQFWVNSDSNRIFLSNQIFESRDFPSLIDLGIANFLAIWQSARFQNGFVWWKPIQIENDANIHKVARWVTWLRQFKINRFEYLDTFDSIPIHIFDFECPSLLLMTTDLCGCAAYTSMADWRKTAVEIGRGETVQPLHQRIGMSVLIRRWRPTIQRCHHSKVVCYNNTKHPLA